MGFRLEEIEALSGGACTIYSVVEDGEELSLFDEFLSEYEEDYEDEVVDLYNRIKYIANESGARDHFFKLHEGSPGDQICALFDRPDKVLRLYCIKYGKSLIILGGGGPKTTRTWQEDPKLYEAMNKLKMISVRIYDAQLAKETKLDNINNTFTETNFNDHD